ncbi:hypothetical protein QBC34DRAFT_464015 [Podospora aff. communis PSN243]|uniref:Uncharacterized protein n=1 Tax=Podospora aff. communis PSN243 TaxID=3040156 RepID=A0AAV9GK26_9PEZI|nr:hypothetical protein QBC34DRAFT_464015 [Podospora aff. communis PSN243]
MSYSDAKGSSSDLSSGQRISLPHGWKWTDADSKYGDDYRSGPKQDEDAPLGILTYLEGKKFVGGGINMLFRPNNIVAGANTVKFPNPISPPPPQLPNNNVLEINLFQETLTFGTRIGKNIPNRGFKCQGDIGLNGIMYVQSINDVTNCETGLPDGKTSAIHCENGMFIHVPATDKDPVVAATIGRLGSIPHGVSINLQGLEPTAVTQGPPQIVAPPNCTMPTRFIQSIDPLEVFPALVAANNDTARIPQILDPFVKTGTITDEIMADPTAVLRAANQSRNILSTITLTMSTSDQAANVPSGGGVIGNAFLDGAGGKGNASAASVDFTLWIETVEYEVPLPAGTTMKAGTGVTVAFEGITYSLTPPKDIVVPVAGQTISVRVTELQYFQMVVLQFGILSWPHPTVSTLRPDVWAVGEGDDAWSGL